MSSSSKRITLSLLVLLALATVSAGWVMSSALALRTSGFAWRELVGAVGGMALLLPTSGLLLHIVAKVAQAKKRTDGLRSKTRSTTTQEYVQ
ncbi:MAG: hypothetical protein M1274_11765 [Actinobacteria bacterium]|nr:hypothetical protein [Actinomycetota bacterium]